MDGMEYKVRAQIDQLGATARDFGDNITISRGEAMILMRMAEIGGEFTIYESLRRKGDTDQRFTIEAVRKAYDDAFKGYVDKSGKDEQFIVAVVIASTQSVLESLHDRVYPT
jgi:hypothetical protein